MVHQRRLQHWILLDICFADRYVRSYDSISSSGASPDVKEAAVPWLSLHVLGPDFSFSTPRCPQQDNDTSCGAFALLGMQHLLAGNLTLADLDVKSGKHAREILVRTALAKPPIHSKVPHWLVQTKEAHQLFVENFICRAKIEVNAANKKVREAEDAVAEQRQVVVTAEQGVIDAETLLGNAELSSRNYQDYKKLRGALAA
ncbi:hypothetical protein CGCA056_v014983 [Colletotrichum aenigma]|uniref:uncharacterized protein n=1 Tax=Colletotrichum aenigma TaxID=1215731 RepID=UPI0018725583|nr:uncharacterized protein CGCA056_v014983 [Colletotrichum aenigma]KAF5498148.1 hypothetical protein CGCA056_v014983 [Colletotrichum aenigma]